jgi:hypothetical protein
LSSVRCPLPLDPSWTPGRVDQQVLQELPAAEQQVGQGRCSPSAPQPHKMRPKNRRLINSWGRRGGHGCREPRRPSGCEQQSRPDRADRGLTGPGNHPDSLLLAQCASLPRGLLVPSRRPSCVLVLAILIAPESFALALPTCLTRVQGQGRHWGDQWPQDAPGDRRRSCDLIWVRRLLMGGSRLSGAVPRLRG